MPEVSHAPVVVEEEVAASVVIMEVVAEDMIDMRVVEEVVVDITHRHLVMIAVVSTTTRVAPLANMVLQSAPNIALLLKTFLQE